MLIQLRGKVRRAVVGTMLSEEDRAGIAGARHGECNRCGARCKILFKCPFLVEVKGMFTCSVYDHRPPSFRLFPTVPADRRGWIATRSALRSFAEKRSATKRGHAR
jgi:Fe-S-cluster containining protein